MDGLVLGTFAAVYGSMMLGRVPGLGLDRTGAAFLGAVVLLAAGRITVAEAWEAADPPTLSLLLALMMISAHFRLAGFYSHAVRRIARARISPPALLALFIGAIALLSALLANDIICLAMAPVLIEICARRGLNPKPFLIALACAANVGSAATLIGNPQNMLIGQVLHLSFGGYLLLAAAPVVLGLGAVWAILAAGARGRWRMEGEPIEVAAPPFDPGRTAKGFFVLLGIVAAFLFAPWPREIVALAGAGLLLCSRRTHPREIFEKVDWPLILLFLSLFVVNRVLASSGLLERLLQGLAGAGVRMEQPAWLFSGTVVLSNLVSNVPAVMLLLPSAVHPLAGPILAISSTLAGNLIVVGSIANIIVIDQAARQGVRITWREHARAGVPVTLATLAIAAAWLWLV